MKHETRKMLLLMTLVMMVALMASSFRANKQDERNLKVLPKDISSDSLERVMDGFVTALSVDCAFCHAAKDPAQPKKLDYASDANPLKEITRTMLRMTTDMNNKYMKLLPGQNVQQVSCNTCHRGQTVPH